MNQSSIDPQYQFNRLDKAVQQVSDAISPQSVRTRQEQIEAVENWRELIYGLLYHDRSGLEYDNSTNLLGEEIKRNIQYLRINGFDIQDQRNELTRLIDTRVRLLQKRIQQIVIDLKRETDENLSLMPVEPEGFDNGREEEYNHTQYERYQRRYEAWKETHIETLRYQEQLCHLDRNFTNIEKTIASFIPSVAQQTPTHSAGPPRKEPGITPGFETYIAEAHRLQLIPYLTDNYSNASPEQHGYMLYALVELKYISQSTLNANQTALHRALTETFGKFGTRQALNTAIHRLDDKEISEADKLQIGKYVAQIRAFLKLKEAG